MRPCPRLSAAAQGFGYGADGHEVAVPSAIGGQQVPGGGLHEHAGGAAKVPPVFRGDGGAFFEAVLEGGFF